MSSQDTAGPDFAARRKRLIYRAWHRGIREMDLILGPFAEHHAPDMSDDEVTRLEALMDEQDSDLLSWVTGQKPAPETVDRVLLDAIMRFHQSRSRA